jgi:hypothetical protein
MLKKTVMGHRDVYPQASTTYHAHRTPPKKCRTLWATPREEMKAVEPEKRP